MKLAIATTLAALVGAMTGCGLIAQTKTAEVKQVELGAVNWGRDIATAKKRSGESGKPILVLFQEVPG